MSSGTASNNDYQIRKLAYNKTGDYLAAICYDELQKKWQLEVYGCNRQIIGIPLISNSSKNSIAWHPKNVNLLAYSGEVEKRDEGAYGPVQTNGNGII